MESEEQWEFMKLCPDCHCPIYVKDGETWFMEDGDCNCEIEKGEEIADERDFL